MTDNGVPAGNSFYGKGGHYDVRGRKAVIEEEQERDRLSREASAGKSRLQLAEEATTHRHGRRQMLPSPDEVSLPWLFDQVVSELEVEDESVYGRSKTQKERENDASDAAFFQPDEEVNSSIPWWKKRKEKKLTATLSDMFGADDSDSSSDDEMNLNQHSSQTGHSKSSPPKNKMTSDQVYHHRYSKERVHDSDSKVYSDLDKAASMMELREAVVKQNKRISQHPKRNANKEIITNPYSVGSDERMYRYHYWGDRSIAISAPTSDILHVVRDDLKEHVTERVDKKEILIQQVKELNSDLILAKHTKANIHARFEERREWYEHQLHATSTAEHDQQAMQLTYDTQKNATRQEIFRNVQAEILLYRDRARYLDEPHVHKCIRACCWRCCNTGQKCCGQKTPQPDAKECCFHCCSTCWWKKCINKYDVDTHLQELRDREHVYKGCPMKACCCCCRCRGIQEVYTKPTYLEYEDDVFVAFKTRVVEFEVERKRKKVQAKLELDIAMGLVDENGKRKRKKKKKKKKKPGEEEEEEDSSGDEGNEIGQAK